jgi:peptidyl-prolyl cis-trans isomerase D
VTMLDRMRRHQSWLKWILGIVVVAFVFIYVPQFLRPSGTGALSTDTLATVDGRRILVGTYQRAYNQQLQQLRQAYGDQFNDQMLQQLQMAPRLIQQMVDEESVLAEADRLGIRVSDEELRQRILSIPAFQMNGVFFGQERYEALLRSQRPPVTPAEFEQEVRRQMISEKMQALITGWMQVDEKEVEQEYRKRNEKVKLELAVFTADHFKNAVQPTDADIKAQFQADPEKYRLPEKRRVKYLAVDSNSLKSRMTATPEEIKALYEKNKAMFSTPERVRASHILLKTEGKDKAAVKKQAEAVLAKVKAGGDFAALAKQYSEDTGSKDNGGDLDYFSRASDAAPGAPHMVKEFEDAAFALQVGQTSGLVETEYGFHIIKLTDRKAAVTRTFEQARPQLEDQIKSQKAQAEAGKKADELAGQIKTPADLDTVARAESLAVSDSGFFARDEPLAGLGFAPAVSAKAFEMEVGKVSEKLQTPNGFVWIALVDVKPSSLPTLEEVKDKVKDDVIRIKAVDVAKARAAAMAKAAGSNFAAAAKAAGVEVKTTDLIARGTALPEIGVNQAVEDAVFKLKNGETSEPISTDNAVVVVHVKEKQDVKPEEMSAGKSQLRDELRQQHQGQFFAAYMVKAKDRMTLTYNQAAIDTILSRGAGR